MRFNIQYHVLAIIAAVVVCLLRSGDVRDYAAWRGGSETTTGRIDDIGNIQRSQVRVIKYIYTVDGKAHTGEDYSSAGFVEGGTTTVTYAKSDPSVSTIQPERTDGIYRTSLIVCAVALLPMLTMWFLEILHRFRRPKDQ
jgi:hypothetical protein